MSRAFQEAYQRRFVEEQLPTAWKAGHKNVLLVMPVSSGKTRSSRLVIERLLRLGDWDVWFGAHRRELVEQSAAELAHLEPRVLLAGRVQYVASRARRTRRRPSSSRRSATTTRPGRLPSRRSTSSTRCVATLTS